MEERYTTAFRILVLLTKHPDLLTGNLGQSHKTNGLVFVMLEYAQHCSIAFSVAVGSALLLTPLVRRCARAVGLLDHPDTERKLHPQTIPLGGGVAVFAATSFGLGAVWIWGNPEATRILGNGAQLVALLVSAVIILAVGLLDDCRPMRGRQKLAGQFLAIAILIGSGLHIERIEVFHFTIALGIAGIPFTVLWLLGAINSINLLDGADGFAATIGAVICCAIAGMAVFTDHPVDAAIAAAMAGALLGFLFFNFPPASIFLGDGGSMLIGLLVGAVAIRSSLKGPATMALAAPLAMLSIPLLDTGAAIVRRKLTGRTIYSGDRGHLHHVLLQRGFSPGGVVVGVAVLCAVTAGGALVGVAMKHEICALGSAGALFAILIGTRLFGFSELLLIASRALSFTNSLIQRASRSEMRVHQQTLSLQGSKNWDTLWATVVEFAEARRLIHVKMALNLPWMQENFHAMWERGSGRDGEDGWSVCMPLVTTCGQLLGRIEFSGLATTADEVRQLVLLAEFIESLQPSFDVLADKAPPDRVKPSFDPSGNDMRKAA